MELLKIRCPECKSQEIKERFSYETKNNGNRMLYECCCCKTVFSETKNTFLEGLKKPVSLIVLVVKARTEGMAFNAACRTFEIAKNTLIHWEKRLAALKKTLFLFALAHEFLKMVIEGDELYTKVNKNVPVEDSQGWTIILMERASRFIWVMKCSKKDKRLFKKAIGTLSRIIEKTSDITLMTDGERRYGNLLFEICHELVMTGRRGRPKTTLKKGVKVRIKNKGSQSKKKGRKRPKYQSPISEHPETCSILKIKIFMQIMLRVRMLHFDAKTLHTGVRRILMQKMRMLFKEHWILRGLFIILFKNILQQNRFLLWQ